MQKNQFLRFKKLIPNYFHYTLINIDVEFVSDLIFKENFKLSQIVVKL